MHAYLKLSLYLLFKYLKNDFLIKFIYEMKLFKIYGLKILL